MMDVKRLGRRRWYACTMGMLGFLIGLGLVTLRSRSVKANRVSPTAPAKSVENFHNPRRRMSPELAPVSADPSTRARLTRSYLRLPLSFEENEGQAPSPVRFLSRGPGYTLYLASDGAALALQRPEGGESRQGLGPGRLGTRPGTHTEIRNLRSQIPKAHAGIQSWGSQIQKAHVTIKNLKPQVEKAAAAAVLAMRLAGANRAPRVVGMDALAARSNYFIGNDPARWRRNVPNYARVKVESVYPGIDLVYYGNQRQLEYDFVVAPGADPRAIALSFDTPNGEHATRWPVRLDSNGDLVVPINGGEVRFHKPVVYQLNGAEAKHYVDGRFVIANSKSKIAYQKSQIGFEVASYDRSKPLIIDPTLSYSTYLGGSKDDFGNAIAVDSSGAAYVVGQTASPNFPPGGPVKRSCSACLSLLAAAPDAFVTKLSPDGSAIVYSTYLGGNGNDTGNAIAVDSSGNAYVAGTTVSTDFPTTIGSFQATLGGGGPFPDVFVAKLNPSGSTLAYSTYLGGSGDDEGFGIAVDASGAVYVTGATSSVDFPVLNAYQAKLSGGSGFDAFVTKLDPSGATEVYSTYLGGTGQDEGFAVAVDASGNAYVAGQTLSNNFPTQTPFQGAFGGNTDAFVAKLSFSGSTLSLAYSTYLGGSNVDSASGIAVDSSGSAYVAGVTESPNFPLQNPLQATFGGGTKDAFVAKLNPAGSALVYSTYLGGNQDDTAQGIAVDSAGRAHVVGFTTSGNFPLSGAVQTTYNGNQDAFLARLNPSGCALAFSTYLGGKASDQANNIAVDSAGASYVVGTTFSNDFPTQSPLQPATGGGNDAFAAKMPAFTAPAACLSVPSVTFSPEDVTTTSAAQKVTLTNGGDATLNITSIVATGDFAQTNTCGNSINAGANCTVTLTFSPTSFGARNGAVTITDNAANSPQILNLTGTGNDFGLSSNPATATISRGHSATFTVTLVASPSFTSAVTLACSGAPPDGNCSITPSSITPAGGSSTNATVTVTTVGPSMVAPSRGPRTMPPLAQLFTWPWLLAMLALLVLASLTQAALWRFPELAWLRAALPLAALTLLILLWSGCGAGGGSSTPSSTPPGNYEISVTGSADSGSLTHSIKVGLTVQ